MRVLVVTKLFPNRCRPEFSPFNRHQFAALGRMADVTVLGLIPWFPGVRFVAPSSEAGQSVDVPASEVIDGLQVQHPRVAYLPKIGHGMAGLTYAMSLAPVMFRARHQFDVVLGSFAYPDGWAALRLARMLKIPAVIKLHGGDINVMSNIRGVQKHLRWTMSHAQAVVANSQPLLDKAIEYGARPDRCFLVPNGIDRETFRPRDKIEARKQVGEDPQRPLILFVGRTEHRKGVMTLLDAFTRLSSERPNVKLIIVGKGAQHEMFQQIAQQRGLDVRFTGALPHEKVAPWIAACDVLTLPSWAEGTPNVVLEALSSGRPVVASEVGGIPAVVTQPQQGRLVPPKDPARLADALAEVLDAGYGAEQVAGAVSFMDWNDSASALLHVLERASVETP